MRQVSMQFRTTMDERSAGNILNHDLECCTALLKELLDGYAVMRVRLDQINRSLERLEESRPGLRALRSEAHRVDRDVERFRILLIRIAEMIKADNGI